jgi:hypothetical protein
MIYNGAALGLVWVENHVSLGANETVMGKACFEQRLLDMAYAKVKYYHGNNGIFSDEDHCQECIDTGKLQSFSCVGAQHQNVWAEHAIQTIMYMAQSFMVQPSLHWTDQGSDDISLCCLQGSMWCVFTITSQIAYLALLHWNY